MQAGAEIVVQGMVQGVGFRYFAYEAARRLGVSGYVRNLPNGDVQVFVQGERGMIEEMIRTMKLGPRSAHVTRVHVDWREPEEHFTGFEIRS